MPTPKSPPTAPNADAIARAKSMARTFRLKFLTHLFSHFFWRAQAAATAGALIALALGAPKSVYWGLLGTSLPLALVVLWFQRKRAHLPAWKAVAFLDRYGGYQGRLMHAHAQGKSMGQTPSLQGLRYPSPLRRAHLWVWLGILLCTAAAAVLPIWIERQPVQSQAAQHVLAVAKAKALVQALQDFSQDQDLQEQGEDLLAQLTQSNAGMTPDDFEALERFEEKALDALAQNAQALAEMQEDLEALQEDLQDWQGSPQELQALQDQMQTLREQLSKSPLATSQVQNLLKELKQSAQAQGQADEGKAGKSQTGENQGPSQKQAQQDLQKTLAQMQKRLDQLQKQAAAQLPANMVAAQGKPGEGGDEQGKKIELGSAPLRFNNQGRVQKPGFDAADIDLQPGQTVLMQTRLTKQADRQGKASSISKGVKFNESTTTLQWQQHRKPGHRQAVKEFFGGK